MWILLNPDHGGRTVAFLPPVWTRIPAADRIGVAAVVVLVAFVVLIVGTRARQAHFRSFRRPWGRGTEPVDASWFTPHTLDGFPEEAVRAAFKAEDAPSSDRLYAAWVLATHTHGVSAEWLGRNLALPVEAAHMIVDAAEARRREMVFRDGHDESTGVPPPRAGSAGQTPGK
ncbi:hypothetical protein [Streptomyces monashensis]|uniref:Uncharacterized protein n=1 Tax=Streptomyces monashensis TaxID=1678012 RepID=A0A1S2NZ75_9ACTN|nr:hypothetical protein [Streptomyces monashensis]OIJ86769.1 hypothetical protein BIV23_43600 [Streptomyces monashensis]